MVTGWSNDGMKVVFTWSQNAPYPDLDQLWEISTEGGNPSPLIYLELQTANSPQTDCSLYMNRFLLGSMSQELQRRAK
jgi:hypothetical protein